MSRAHVRKQLASIGLAGILRANQSIRQGVNPSAGPTEPTFILPIDQAEELFATDGQEESRAFLEYIDALLQSRLPTQSDAGSQRLRILLVLTIRSDSLPKLQEQPILQQMSPVLFSLPAMPVSEFKAVIEGPARLHSEKVLPLHITSDLTDQLIRDAQGADALPLLAFTLERLYREFTIPQEGTRIGCGEYQKIGGVRGIIGAAVEHAFEKPNRDPVIPGQREEQERLLRQVFPYIATVDPDTRNSKRQLALRENLRQGLSPQADALVSRLIEQRLLLTDTRPVNDGGTPVEVIEVAHEALLRQWEMLERWLREFAEALSVAELIRRSANDWNRGNRDGVLLVHTGHRLDAAEAIFSDERLAGRFKTVDGDYLAACRLRDRQMLEEKEKQLRQIAEQQNKLLANTLLSAAESAAYANRFDQSLRLAVLAVKLYPANPVALPVLARAADANILHSIFTANNRWRSSVSFSPDVRRLVTVSYETVRVWDAETGKPMGEPMKHYDGISWVNSASFSPDGRWVITASGNETQIWNVYWSSIDQPDRLIAEVCSRKLSGNVRKLTVADCNLEFGIPESWIGMDVCEYVAIPITRQMGGSKI